MVPSLQRKDPYSFWIILVVIDIDSCWNPTVHIGEIHSVLHGFWVKSSIFRWTAPEKIDTIKGTQHSVVENRSNRYKSHFILNQSLHPDHPRLMSCLVEIKTVCFSLAMALAQLRGSLPASCAFSRSNAAKRNFGRAPSFLFSTCFWYIYMYIINIHIDM